MIPTRQQEFRHIVLLTMVRFDGDCHDHRGRDIVPFDELDLLQ